MQNDSIYITKIKWKHRGYTVEDRVWAMSDGTILRQWTKDDFDKYRVTDKIEACVRDGDVYKDVLLHCKELRMVYPTKDGEAMLRGHNVVIDYDDGVGEMVDTNYDEDWSVK